MTFNDNSLEQQQRQIEALRKQLNGLNATFDALQRQASDAEGSFDNVPDDNPDLLAMLKQAQDKENQSRHPDPGTTTPRMPGLRRRGAIRM